MIYYIIQLIKCILQHSCESSFVWDCEGYNVLGNLAQLSMIMSAGVTVVSLCVFTWDVNVFLKFCKILVSIRFVEFVFGSFSCFEHWSCLFKLHFMWSLNSQFICVQVKNVENSAKQAHPRLRNNIVYQIWRRVWLIFNLILLTL